MNPQYKQGDIVHVIDPSESFHHLNFIVVSVNDKEQTVVVRHSAKELADLRFTYHFHQIQHGTAPTTHDFKQGELIVMSDAGMETVYVITVVQGNILHYKALGQEHFRGNQLHTAASLVRRPTTFNVSPDNLPFEHLDIVKVKPEFEDQTSYAKMPDGTPRYFVFVTYNQNNTAFLRAQDLNGAITIPLNHLEKA